MYIYDTWNKNRWVCRNVAFASNVSMCDQQLPHNIYKYVWELHYSVCSICTHTHVRMHTHTLAKAAHTHMCLFEKSYAILNCDRQTFTLCLTHLLNLSHSFTFSRMVYLCVSVSLCMCELGRAYFPFVSVLPFLLSCSLRCLYYWNVSIHTTSSSIYFIYSVQFYIYMYAEKAAARRHCPLLYCFVI